MLSVSNSYPLWAHHLLYQRMASYWEHPKFSAWGFSLPRYTGQAGRARTLTLPGTAPSQSCRKLSDTYPFLHSLGGQLWDLFHTAFLGPPGRLDSVCPCGNLLIHAPCVGFCRFPLSLSFLLAGAFWDCLQNNRSHSDSSFRMETSLNTVSHNVNRLSILDDWV